MKKEYKGCSIEFDEQRDCFVAWQDGEQFAENVSLAKLKGQIDMLKKKSFERIPIYYFRNQIEKHEGEITSFNSIEKEVWVSYGKDKDREKVNLKYSDRDNLVRKTKENLALIENISKNLSQIEHLEAENEKLGDKLDHYDYKELCKISGQTEIED